MTRTNGTQMSQRRKPALYKALFIENFGPGPWQCDFNCGQLVTALKQGKEYDGGHVHHLDEDFTNNDPANLGVMHPICHSRHHRGGKPGNQLGAKLSTETRAKMSAYWSGRKRAPRPAEMYKRAAEKRRGQPHVEMKYKCDGCDRVLMAGPMKRHQDASGHTGREEIITKESK